MLGSQIVFGKQVQKANPKILIIHSFLWTENLTRTIQPKLSTILQDIM